MKLYAISWFYPEAVTTQKGSTLAFVRLKAVWGDWRQQDLPSIYEGFGIAVLEAFTHGTPVICSRGAAIPEVAGDAAVYFNPLDPREMADAIHSVLGNASLRKELIKRGTLRTRRFTWKRTAEQTLAVYRQVVDAVGVQ